MLIFNQRIWFNRFILIVSYCFGFDVCSLGCSGSDLSFLSQFAVITWWCISWNRRTGRPEWRTTVSPSWLRPSGWTSASFLLGDKSQNCWPFPRRTFSSFLRWFFRSSIRRPYCFSSLLLLFYLDATSFLWYGNSKWKDWTVCFFAWIDWVFKVLKIWLIFLIRFWRLVALGLVKVEVRSKHLFLFESKFEFSKNRSNKSSNLENPERSSEF